MFSRGGAGRIRSPPPPSARIYARCAIFTFQYSASKKSEVNIFVFWISACPFVSDLSKWCSRVPFFASNVILFRCNPHGERRGVRQPMHVAGEEVCYNWIGLR